MASAKVETLRATLGARITALVAGKSQQAVAATLGMHQTGLSAAMRGKVSVEKLIDVLEALGDPVKVVA